MGLIEAFCSILQTPTSIGGGFVLETMLFIIPIWTAFLLGIMVGWAWKPDWWARNKLDSFVSKITDFSVPSSPSKGFPSIQSFSPFNMRFSGGKSEVDEVRANDNNSLSMELSTVGGARSSSSQLKGNNEENPVVNDDDLAHLAKLVEEKDGGPSWIQMMDKSTPTMTYRAWRRDPETGPPQYRSSTIFEDATPEMVRDFFWDDEFRPKWDTMLIHSETLEASPTTGTMIVQWIRKFPFFCSDREYIVGRRIWDAGRTFYCVTKGVPCPSVPRRDKPRRVDVYYSSWCIRPVSYTVESKRRTGQKTACEVLLFHHEDMGIPWEIAKLGVRQGMWGCVKKIDPGLRAYQKARAAGAPLSNAASMAHIVTKVSQDYLRTLLSGEDHVHNQITAPAEEKNKEGFNVPKALMLGGAVVLACSLDRGLLTKAVIFGVARRIGRIGGGNL